MSAIRDLIAAKPEKQFLFWDFSPKKTIGSGCNPGGCGLQGEVKY